MKNDALNLLHFSTIFTPGVTNPVSVGLKAIPSHFTSFDHGGYSSDPDFNILLSNYIKYLVKAYDFLVAENVSASLLVNDRAISKQLSLLAENLTDSNFDGSKNEDLSNLSEIITRFAETDAALDSYMRAKSVEIIFSDYVNGSDFYTEQKFAAAALAYAYLADHKIDSSAATNFDGLVTLFSQATITNSEAEDLKYYKQLLGRLKSISVIQQIYGDYRPGDDPLKDREYKAAGAAAVYFTGHGTDLTGVTTFSGLVNTCKTATVVTVDTEDERARMAAIGGLVSIGIINNIAEFNDYETGSDYHKDRRYNAIIAAAIYYGGHGTDLSAVNSFSAIASAVRSAIVTTVDDEDAIALTQVLGTLMSNKFIESITEYADYIPGKNFHRDRYYNTAFAAASYLEGHGINLDNTTSYDQLATIFKTNRTSITTSYTKARYNEADEMTKAATLGALVANQVLANISEYANYIPGDDYIKDRKYNAALSGIIFLAGHGVDVSDITDYNQVLPKFRNASFMTIGNDDVMQKLQSLGGLEANALIDGIPLYANYKPGIEDIIADRKYNAFIEAASWLGGRGVSLVGISNYDQLISLFQSNYNSTVPIGNADKALKASVSGNLIAEKILPVIYPSYNPDTADNTVQHFYDATAAAASYLGGHNVPGILSMSSNADLKAAFEDIYNGTIDSSGWGINDERLRASVYGNLVSTMALNTVYQLYVPGKDYIKDKEYDNLAIATAFLAAHHIDVSGITDFAGVISTFNNNYSQAVDTTLFGERDKNQRAEVWGNLVSTKILKDIYGTYVPGNDAYKDKSYKAAGLALTYLAAHRDVDLTGISTYSHLVDRFQQNFSTLLDYDIFEKQDEASRGQIFGNLVANQVLDKLFPNYLPGKNPVKDAVYDAVLAAAIYLGGHNVNIDINNLTSFNSLIPLMKQVIDGAYGSVDWGETDKIARNEVFAGLVTNDRLAVIYPNYMAGEVYNKDWEYAVATNALYFLASKDIELSAVSTFATLVQKVVDVLAGGYNSGSWSANEEYYLRKIFGDIESKRLLTFLFTDNYIPGRVIQKDQEYEAVNAAVSFLTLHNIELSGIINYGLLTHMVKTASFDGAYNSQNWSIEDKQGVKQLHGNLRANIAIKQVYPSYVPGDSFTRDRDYNTALEAVTYLAAHNIILDTITSYQQVVDLFAGIKNNSIPFIYLNEIDRKLGKTLHDNLIKNTVLNNIFGSNYNPGQDYIKDKQYHASLNTILFLSKYDINLMSITNFDALAWELDIYAQVPPNSSDNEMAYALNSHNVAIDLITRVIEYYSNNPIKNGVSPIYIPGEDSLWDKYIQDIENAFKYISLKEKLLVGSQAYAAIYFNNSLDGLLSFLNQAQTGIINTSSWGYNSHTEIKELYNNLKIIQKLITEFSDYREKSDITTQYDIEFKQAAYQLLLRNNVDINSFILAPDNVTVLNIIEQLKQGLIDIGLWNKNDWKNIERLKNLLILNGSESLKAIFPNYGTNKLPPDPIAADTNPTLIVQFYESILPGQDILMDNMYGNTLFGGAYLMSHNINLENYHYNILNAFEDIKSGIIDSSSWGKDDEKHRTNLYKKAMCDQLAWHILSMEFYLYDFAEIDLPEFSGNKIADALAMHPIHYNIINNKNDYYKGKNKRYAILFTALYYLIEHDITITYAGGPYISVDDYYTQDIINKFNEANNGTIDSSNWGTGDKEKRKLIYSRLISEKVADNIYGTVQGSDPDFGNIPVNPDLKAQVKYDSVKQTLQYLALNGFNISQITTISEVRNYLGSVTNQFIENNDLGSDAKTARDRLLDKFLISDALENIAEGRKTIYHDNRLTLQKNMDLAYNALNFLNSHKISVSGVTDFLNIKNIIEDVNTGVINSEYWGQKNNLLVQKIYQSIVNSINSNPLSHIFSEKFILDENQNIKKVYIYYTGFLKPYEWEITYNETTNQWYSQQDDGEDFYSLMYKIQYESDAYVNMANSTSVSYHISRACEIITQFGFQWGTDFAIGGNTEFIYDEILNLLYSISSNIYGPGWEERFQVYNFLRNEMGYNYLTSHNRYTQSIQSFNSNLSAVDIFGDIIITDLEPYILSYETLSEREESLRHHMNALTINYLGYAAPPEPYEGSAPEMFFDKQRRLQSVVSYYRIQAQNAYSQGNTFEGDHFTSLANDYELQLKDIRDYNSNLMIQLQDHERISREADPAYIERKNIYSFIRNDYNTMSLFSKGYGNYEIEQLFNAFGWPRWANDFDTWAGDENYQAWLNASGNLINSRLFYDAMVALGDPAVRYWSALNTGNDDFAYAFTRLTHDGVYFRTNYQGDTFITGPDGFRAYQPNGGIMDLSLMDRLGITTPLRTPPAFAMQDLSKTTISPQLAETFLKMGIPLYNVTLGTADYTEGGYYNQAFLGYSMFSPDYFAGTPLAEVVTKGTRYTFGQNNIYPGNSLIVNSRIDYGAVLANATAAAWNAFINPSPVYRPDEVVISMPGAVVTRRNDKFEINYGLSPKSIGLTELGYGLGATGIYLGAREYSNVVRSKLIGIEKWKGANRNWYSLEWGGNKWTGARSIAIENANYFARMGKTVFWIGAGVSAIQAYKVYQKKDWEGVQKSAIDIGMAAVATYGGPVGWVVGGVWFILDFSTGGFKLNIIDSNYYSPFPAQDNTYYKFK